MTILHTSTYQASGSATVHTCAISPTPVAGHKLVAHAAKGAPESSHSAGWTKVPNATDLNACELDTYERWSDGTETQFAVTLSSAATACIAVFENSGFQNAAADVAANYTNTVSFAHEILADNPTAFWALQEASGTTATDSAASPHDGTYTGTFALNQPGPLVDLSVGAAFTAGAGYVNVPNTAALRFGSATTLTVEFALKAATTNPGSFKYIVSMNDGSGSKGYFVYNSGSGLGLGIGAAGAAKVGSVVHTWDTNWHHYVFVFDAAAHGASWVDIYIDGVSVHGAFLVNGATTVPIIADATDPLRLMDYSGDSTNGFTFPGTLAYAAIYPTALSASRIAQHYSVFSAGVSSSSPNTGTTGVVASAGDVDFAAFAYQSLTDDTVTGYSGTFTSAAHLISTNGTGTKTHLDVATQTAGGVSTQIATILYGAAQTRRSANIVAFLPSSGTGTGKIYPKYLESLLDNSPSIPLTNWKAALGRIADGFVYNPADQFLSAVVATLVSTYGTSVAIPGLTGTLGVVRSTTPRIQFPVSTGAACDFIIVFADGGSAAASPLIGYFPLLNPVTPVSGQVVQIDWDTGSHVLDGIFAI